MTGTSLKRNITLSKFAETNALPLTLVNDHTEAVKPGQEVYVTADNSVTPRTTGAQFAIGTIKVGGKPGEDISVETVFNRDMKCQATGAAIDAGDFVRQNGTVSADGLPQVVEAAAGNYVLGIALTGGAVNSVIRVGVLRNPIKI